MRFLHRLGRGLSRFAVPNLTLALIVSQVAAYAVVYMLPAAGAGKDVEALERIALIPARVLDGEVWRLATFLAVPPIEFLLFAFFFWYLFYLMGTVLEHNWGTPRYNAFLLVGYVATVAAAFLTPQAMASNAFLQGSVFLAFAFLFPDFELRLFFILPVKIKWLALIAWIIYGLAFAFGDWPARAMVFASVANFLLFFGRDVAERMSTGRRRMATQAARLRVREPEFRHRCADCGITDKTHPQAEFRYCSKCDGGLAYCADHLRTHEHKAAAEQTPA